MILINFFFCFCKQDYLQLLVSSYQSGQGHAGDGADQFDRLAVVDVTVSHSELFSFRLLVIHWKHRRGQPLTYSRDNSTKATLCKASFPRAYAGGCRRRPTAGSWRGSCRPPRVGSACWLFGTAAGWRAPPWSPRRCTLRHRHQSRGQRVTGWTADVYMWHCGPSAEAVLPSSGRRWLGPWG